MSARFLVFSQSPEPRLDTEELVRAAARYGRESVQILSAEAPVRVSIASAESALRGTFSIVARPRTDDDLAAASEAEARGRAGGMAALAARCPTVWEIEADEGASEIAELALVAMLAFVALGPAMPADRSTLFGVRGARDRAEKLSNAAPGGSGNRDA